MDNIRGSDLQMNVTLGQRLSDNVSYSAVGGEILRPYNDTVAMLNATGPKIDYALIRYVSFVAMGVIIPMGIICNAVSLAVFLTSRSLRKTATGSYLMALSLADMLFLLGECFRWMHTSSGNGTYLDVTFMTTSDAACKCIYVLRYGAKLSSAWIIVAFTLERFISVRYPLKLSTISTKARTRGLLAAVFLACFTLGSYPAWTVGSGIHKGHPACLITSQKVYDAWSWAILRIGSLLLPAVFMFVITGLIIYVLSKARVQRMRSLSIVVKANAHPRRSKVETQLTVILLGIAIAFLLLRFPYMITYYINHYKKDIWVPIDPWFSYEIYVANKICDIIATSNYIVNFFLYCVCGSAFRDQLGNVVRCRSPPPAKFSHATQSTHCNQSPWTSLKSQLTSSDETLKLTTTIYNKH